MKRKKYIKFGANVTSQYEIDSSYLLSVSDENSKSETDLLFFHCAPGGARFLRVQVKDERVVQMVKRYLKSGVMENGVVTETEESFAAILSYSLGLHFWGLWL